jgi:hypothetical protein
MGMKASDFPGDRYSLVVICSWAGERLVCSLTHHDADGSYVSDQAIHDPVPFSTLHVDPDPSPALDGEPPNLNERNTVQGDEWLFKE